MDLDSIPRGCWTNGSHKEDTGVQIKLGSDGSLMTLGTESIAWPITGQVHQRHKKASSEESVLGAMAWQCR